MKKIRTLVIFITALVLPGTLLFLWLADRPEDTLPHIPDGIEGFAFDPQFGPKTPQEVEKYLQNRAGSRRGDMAEAVDTLRYRWGLRPGMKQWEIDEVQLLREKLWAFMKNAKTPRYKVRSWLGLN